MRSIKIAVFSIFSLVSISSFAQSGLETKSLVECIHSSMQTENSRAGEAAYNYCQSKRQNWLISCQLENPTGSSRPSRFDTAAYERCERDKLYKLTRDIDKKRDAEYEKKHPNPKPAKLEALVVPDLNKPVYLKNGAYVCDSSGALANPSRDIAVYTGYCAYNKKDRQVRVHMPRTTQAMMEARINQHILVSWRPGAMSDGNVYSAYTNPKNLRN